MAQVVHLYCRHCGEPMKNNPWPYCAPCNLELCYRAMPILLGMMVIGKRGTPFSPVPVAARPNDGMNRWKRYPHLRYIMD